MNSEETETIVVNIQAKGISKKEAAVLSNFLFSIQVKNREDIAKSCKVNIGDELSVNYELNFIYLRGLRQRLEACIHVIQNTNAKIKVSNLTLLQFESATIVRYIEELKKLEAFEAGK